jgi:hypothetical protein
MRFALRTVAALAVVAGCDAAPSAPDPATTPSLARAVSSRTDFATIATNPCPPVPELVPLTGFMHIVTKPEVTPEGVRLRIHRNAHASGIGAITGLKYEFQNLSRQEVLPPSGTITFESELLDRFHEISQGSADNFFFMMRSKITCDAMGCRVEVIETEAECRG